MQPFVFVAFIFYRAFVFSCLTTFMARFFGYDTLGKVMGSALLLGGCGGLVQTPLLHWAFVKGGLGDFVPPNLLLLSLSVLSGIFPFWVALHTGELKCCRHSHASTGSSET
jgi:hypothetical protein